MSSTFDERLPLAFSVSRGRSIDSNGLISIRSHSDPRHTSCLSSSSSSSSITLSVHKYWSDMLSSNARARIDFLKDHPYGYRNAPARRDHERYVENAVSDAVLMRSRFQQHLKLSGELVTGYNQGVGDKRRYFGDKFGEDSHGDGYPHHYCGSSRKSQGNNPHGTHSSHSNKSYSERSHQAPVQW